MNDNVLFEIKGLQKKFGELTVFDGLDETISKGDVVVIIGPSGGGQIHLYPMPEFVGAAHSGHHSL